MKILWSLAGVVLFVTTCNVSAQNFPPGLLQAIPQAAQKLSSDDVNERASVLRELVVPAPLSCTGEKTLAFDLTKDDYAFVVQSVLERDLRMLDAKTAGSDWSLLTHLIVRFQMKEFAAPLAAYLGESYSGDLQLSIPYMLIQTLDSLEAKQFDYKIVPYVNSPHFSYQALNTLIKFKSKTAVPVLLEKLSDSKWAFWALEKLVEIDAAEAGPEIAKLLFDERENIAYLAVDALAKLDASAQARDLWQFVKYTKDARSQGYAIAALLKFGEKNAIPIAIDKLKGVGQETEEDYTWHFIDKLKPKILIPPLISLYNTKAPFFADADVDKFFRRIIVDKLAQYRTPVAIPIYRENLVNRFDRIPTPSGSMAALLQQMDAREAIDDITVLFNESAKGEPGHESDHRAGELGIVLAKFGDRKTWKLLIDYVERSKYWGRGQIIGELNRQVDKKLWDRTHTLMPRLSPATPFRAAIGKISVETGIPIIVENVTRKDRVECFISDPDERDGILCGYDSGTDNFYHVLNTLINSLDYPQRGQYTFIFDKGAIRIMRVENAVAWWRTKMLKD
jgi:hypothetical protein